MLLGLFSTLFFVSSALAQDLNDLNVNQDMSDMDMSFPEPCGGSSSYYQAMSEVEEGDFSIYVKLGIPDGAADVSLYHESMIDDTGSSSCVNIGSINATGSQWKKVGEWSNNDSQNIGTFLLFTPDAVGLPTANRPSIMLVSNVNPVCVPQQDCSILVDGREGVLAPEGVLYSQDSLHMFVAHGVDNDKLAKVSYFVDNKFAYSSESIGEFDLRYVSSGEHELTTIASYQSGQNVIFKENIKHGAVGELKYILSSIVFGHRVLLRASGVALGVWLTIIATLSFIRYLYSRYLWKKLHFPDRVRDNRRNRLLEKLSISKYFVFLESHNFTMAKWGGYGLSLVAVSMLVVIGVSDYGLGVYNTDGVSMQDTLHTGDVLPVSKVQKTWGELTKRNYVPKRGQIVVFYKEVNNILAGESESSKEYVVKRVFALPGERIKVDGQEVRIFNEAFPDGFDPQKDSKWVEKAHLENPYNIDITLGPEEVFVMGDNRPESIDSRSHGPIKLDNVIGNVIFR